MIFSHIKYAQYRESLKITEEIPTGMSYVHTTELRVKRNRIVFKDSTDKDNYILLNDADVKSYIETRRIELEAEKKAAQEARLAELKETHMQSQEVETETTTETKTE